MFMRDLIPWGRNREIETAPSFRDDSRGPFFALHREMDRLFDDFHRAFAGRGAVGGDGFVGAWPNVEIGETDSAIVVTAEVPGLEEKDVELLLDGAALTLKGERRHEVNGGDRQFSERFYGRFERRIPLSVEIDQDKVEAMFRDGVLTVTLPKTARAQERVKRIEIKR